MRVLITGGFGFIGQRLVKYLLALDDSIEINVVDSVSHQIHGARFSLPDFYQNKRVNLFFGGVEDASLLKLASAECSRVVHLAAETGTGQSMYSIDKYARTNILGTTNLLEVLASSKGFIDRVVVASSRSIYGEGKYHCQQHGNVYPRAREISDLQAGLFEPRCPICGQFVKAVASDEDTAKQSASFYALTKQFQEESLLLFSDAYAYEAIALRYQNVYGPGQSLSNPYTGLLAVFSNLARYGKDITVFEDGLETRDFVHVDDVVRATATALLRSNLNNSIYNVGSGVATSVLDVANHVVSYFGGKSKVRVTGSFRVGDIRHNYADLSRIQADFGFVPQINFADGIKTFLDWAENSEPGSIEKFATSLEEMRNKGLYYEK